MAVTSSQGIRTISGSGNLDIRSVFLSGAGVPVVTPVTTTETWLYQNTLTGDLYRWSVQSLTWIKFATVPSDIGAIDDAPIDGNQYVRQDGAWEQVELPSNGMPVVSPAVAGNLVVQAADGTLVDAGYAADVLGTPETVVRRNIDGHIEIYCDNDAIRATSDTGFAVNAVSQTGGGGFSQSVSGTVHHRFGGVSEIRRTTGLLAFLGANAAANRLAQSNEIQAVNYGAAQTLTAGEQAQARTNIGVGTAGTLTAGATGSSLVTSATVDGARGVLLMPSSTLPSKKIIHYTYPSWTTVATGSGTGVASTLPIFVQDLATGVTPNSTARRYVADNASVGRVGFGQFADWSRRMVFVVNMSLFVLNAEGVCRMFFGKTTAAAFGLAATGNYVAVELTNNVITALHVCKAGVVSSAATSSTFGPQDNVHIVSQNGNVALYKNSVLLAQTANGPNVLSTGGVHYEIQNGPAAANYRAFIATESEAF